MVGLDFSASDADLLELALGSSAPIALLAGILLLLAVIGTAVKYTRRMGDHL